MKPQLKILPLVFALVILLSTLIGYVAFSLLKPIPLEIIPPESYREFSDLWETHMLSGEGAHYLSNGDRRPAISTPDLYQQSASAAVFGQSGVIIDTPTFANGDYIRIQGGPIDKLIGNTVTYFLYAKEVGQFHNAKKLSFNDGYYFQYNDYYLIQRDLNTRTSQVLKKWSGLKSEFGYIALDVETNELVVTICPIGFERFTVPQDESFTEEAGTTDVICQANRPLP